MKYTPDIILTLEPWEIFCFGSNESGIHGAGAAKKALDFGAVIGEGIGLFGATYAIPTKDANIKTLPLKAIQVHVDQFIRFSRYYPNLEFLVTKIGCGLAGYHVAEIAPLFKEALDKPNIILPKAFHDHFEVENYLNKTKKVTKEILNQLKQQ